MSKLPKSPTGLAPYTQLPGGLVISAPVAERMEDLAFQSKSANTWRAYRQGWADFVEFCKTNGAKALPADALTVAAYITERSAGHSIATIELRLTAISQAHKAKKLQSPTSSVEVKTILKGLKRTKGTQQVQKAPVLTSVVMDMVKMIDSEGPVGKITGPLGLGALRDRALLLLGFSLACRRSELVGIDVEHLKMLPDPLRMVVLIAKSKTDQVGHGRKVVISSSPDPVFCPVRAVNAWLKASGIITGPVFRGVLQADRGIRPGRLTAAVVAEVVKEYALKLGLDPETFAGHSLRSGHITSALDRNVGLPDIMATTGHKSTTMVLRYRRFNEQAVTSSGQLGLGEKKNPEVK
ncbi:MAG: tyrosine-type recombinase/integrase [Dehalococcoidia bacterium]|nr:tyrosine-type recombinase/integrase [Dehalococcoidia bacterium]